MRAMQRSVSAAGKRSREGLDVRLLTAVDMHGLSGRPGRSEGTGSPQSRVGRDRCPGGSWCPPLFVILDVAQRAERRR